MLRVVRVHAGTVILPELSEKLGTYVQNNWRTRRRDPCKHESGYGFDVWGRQQKKANLGFLSTGETFGFIPCCPTHERRA
jgi:hypothetical protein